MLFRDLTREEKNLICKKVDEYLSNIEYESNSIDKDIDKYKRKYSDKNKLINALLRKGYSYEDIKSKLNE